MKLLITLTVLLTTFVCSGASAQQLTNGAFPQNHWVINAGLGSGGIYYNGYSGNVDHLSPSLSVDYMITHKLGIGQLSAGLIVSYAPQDVSYNTVYSSGDIIHHQYKYTSILFGIRAAYHFIVPVKGLDPYAGVMLANINQNYPTMIGGTVPNQKQTTGGIYAGVHYFFLRWLGVFGEIGKNGFSIATLGVSFKL